MDIPGIDEVPFGRTGPAVTVVGLGGEGILRTHGEEAGALRVIEEAFTQGIRYFDCARAYAGSEGYYGRFWSVRGAVRERVFQTSKSAARSREGALADLDATLATMAVDHLDLWQIHDVRTARDLDRISSPGGALEAFVDARAAGKVRFIGVTGHHDPLVLTRAVKEWPVDAVLLPVNPVESTLGGFLDATLPAALAKGLAVIGMKVLGASHYVQPQAGVTAELLLRFALSQPITTVIVGCSRMEEVRTLAHAGRARMPLDAAAQRAIVDLFAPHARRLAYYRGTL